MNLGLDSEPLVWYYIDTGRSDNAQSTGKERKKNMAIDFKNLLTVLPLVTDAGHPVLLRGRHGIGKSSVVYQYAESLGMPIVERRASQMTEGDLLGLPTVDEGVTSFCPPDWFATACDNGVVLFLDEVDRATLEVRQGIFELCDSRKLAGHALHPDTLIFAAVNGGTHAGAASYQVGEMDPAELDRYTVFDVEPSVDDWLSWAQTNCDALVTDFIRNNVEHLEHNDDPEPNKVYPSRRSWARFSDTVGRGGMLEAGSSNPAVFSLASAYLGFEAAVAFNDFVANYSKVVTVSDILDKGLTPDIDLNAHCALIDKLGASERMAYSLNDSEITNLATYFTSLPSEPAMKLWTVVGNACQDNAIALHSAEDANGRKVGSYLVEILTGDTV